MFFRNLTFFRFPATTADRLRELAARTIDGALLDDDLGGYALKPVGPLDLYSRGFVPPLGQGSEAMFHQVGHAIWITLGGEDKILPASAVNRELQKRLDAIEEREGRKPGGRARKRLKDDVVTELLPRALVKPYRLDAYLDLERGFLAVDTSSRKAAETLASNLRHALGSFPALPLNAEVAPRAVLTGWLAGDDLPEGGYDGDKELGGFVRLGEEGELRDAADAGGVVRFQRQDLAGEEVARHLEAGKQATRLGLVLDDHVSFTFGEDLVVRKVKFLDGAVEALVDTEREDLRAELDARFALMAGEVGHLFDVLERAFRFSKAEG